MVSEKQERLDFLTRMAEQFAKTRMTQHIPVEAEDLGRLIQMACIAEKEKDDRQQHAFERLCQSGASFYEA